MYCLTISRRVAFGALLLLLATAVPVLRAQELRADVTRLDTTPDAPLPVVQDQQQTAPSKPAAAAQQPQANANQSADDLKNEMHQRIMGVMPSFNVMNNKEAPPLSPKQKFHLFWKSSTDPFIFATAAVVSGIGQAQDNFPEYGQGMEGYAKRFGAAYADTFDGNLWGNAILPTLLHEDPRYFPKGTGSVSSRVIHAALSTVWCRRDNGSWGPNYANVGGNIIAGSISNLYYPESDRGLGLTFSRAMVVTAEGAIGAQLFEFWPDIQRKLFKRGPQNVPQSQTTNAVPKS
jgi:hypothetical protein